MSCSRTCNPYFVKSLNLRTSMYNGDSMDLDDSDDDDPEMSKLKSFLQSNLESFLKQNEKVAKILSDKLKIYDMGHNMEDLYDTLDHEIRDALEKKTMSDTEPEIRESYAQMSEWQKAIWDDLIYESSDYTAQEACIEFLKLISSMDIREDPAYKEACENNELASIQHRIKKQAALEAEACANNEIALNQYRINEQAASEAKKKSRKDYMKAVNQANTTLRTQLSTSMQNFLHAHGIDAQFANTLRTSRNVISDVHQLPQYIANMQQQVENRVDISNVTPLERRLWNLLVTQQTPPESQQAIQEFIKIALIAMGQLYDQTYRHKLKPPDLNNKTDQAAFYIDDLDANHYMSGQQAFVTVLMFPEYEMWQKDKWMNRIVYWKYDEHKNKFHLCYAGKYGPTPLSSLESIIWAIN